MNGEVDQRLDDLQRRVERLEAKAGFAMVEPTVAATKPPSVAVEAEAPRPLAPPLPVPPSAVVPPANVPLARPVAAQVPLHDWVASAAAKRAVQSQTKLAGTSGADDSSAPPRRQQETSPVVLPYHAPPAPKPLRSTPLEQLIGLKWAGWIGAIVLVIGTGIGIKYAYDIGLLGAVKPAVRLVLMSLGGFGLIGAGEWVFRKVNRISATGLFGAGVATLFLVSYAGHGYYGLYQRDTAFTLMAISTLVGAAVALRGNLVSIAVLSLIGGNIAPIVLRGDSVHVGAFATYLLMLQVVALVLAFVKADGKWWILRGLSLATTSLWVLFPMLHAAKNPWGVELVFVLIYAGIYQLEVVGAVLSRKRRESGEESACFSLMVTALLTAAILFVFRDASHFVRGMWVMGIACVCAFAAFLLRSEVVKSLRKGFAIQSAALVVLAVPVALAGMWIGIGWAMLAVAFATLGFFTDIKLARAAGAVTWGLAIGHLISWTSSSPVANDFWFTVFGEHLEAWAIIASFVALAGHTIGALQRGETRWKSSTFSALASVIIVVATLGTLSPFAATMTLVAYGWLLTAGDRALPKLSMLAQSSCVLIFATAKWALVDTLKARLDPSWSPGNYVPLFNPLIGTALVIAGSLVAIYWLRREGIHRLIAKLEGPANPMLIVGAIVILTMTFALSLEIDRVIMLAPVHTWPREQMRQMSWTMLWTAASVGYIALCTRALGKRIVPRMAWTLPIMLAIKFVLIDTLMWRGTNVTPLLNMQVMTALVVVAGFVIVHHLLRRADAAYGDDDLSVRVGFMAALVLLWAGTFEIDRLIASGALTMLVTWPRGQLEQLMWSAWWMTGICAFLLLNRKRATSPALRKIAVIPLLVALKFVVVDTGLWRLASRPAMAMALTNVQTATSAIVIVGLGLVWYLLPAREGKRRDIRALSAGLGVIVVLWTMTLEIDRFFETSPMALGITDPHLAKQVAFSIFWSLFAIGAVALGFRLRAAELRYFGLGLFALTLVKVFIVDLSGASSGYRFASFMGLGLLMIGTSVVYGKLSPKLLEAR